MNERLKRGVGLWTAFYRANPHRFARDYLHLELHLFQKIMIVMMFICTNVCFIGSRGIGKTFLSAVFCVIRCILYPGTKICIVSGTRGQGIQVLEKIMMELKPRACRRDRRAKHTDQQHEGTDCFQERKLHQGRYRKRQRSRKPSELLDYRRGKTCQEGYH